MELDVVLLSRLQFALTIMFHYLFPPLTIGMSIVIVWLTYRHWRGNDPLYESAARFWTKLFALNFAIGVASGIVMEFQFGTNWATYSRFVGDVFGSALAAEGIFAFFLESGFLAVLAFGWGRVSKGMHFFSAVMVSVGSIFSSVWITIANSWQQTPAGHHIVQMTRDGQPWFIDGEPVMRAEIVDFWAMVFNPSSVHRLVHVWIGCFIMGAFFVMSISAWYLLRNRHTEFARRSFRGALVIATVMSLAAAVSGHFQARNVYQTQPAKMAAFEGHHDTGKADLTLFGNVAIPGGLSFLIHDDFNASVVGLDRFRPEDQPPLAIPFVTYRLMIGIGVFFIAITLLACVLWWRGTLWNARVLLWVFVFSVLPAVAANQAGWVAAEVGRQPWIVHPPVQWNDAGDLVTGPDGYVQYDETVGLRTTGAISKAVAAEQVLGSIIMFTFIYLLLGALWLMVLNHKIQQGPAPVAEHRDEGFIEAAAHRPDHDRGLIESYDNRGGDA